MKTITQKIIAVGVGIYLTGSMASFGTTFYTDLTSGITTNALALVNNQELGEQVTMANTFALETLTNFSFQIYSTNASFSGVTLDVQFLSATGGTSNAPSSILYDSGYSTLLSPNQLSAGTTVENVTYPYTIPLSVQTFILGITIQGLGTGTNAAVQLYGAPTVGSSPGTYWVNNGSWTRYTNTITGPTYFGSQFSGIQTVPEPSVICLGAIGMAALMGAIRLRRKG